MIRNLKAEMIRNSISAKQLAKFLLISEQAILNKIQEKCDFKSGEMFKLRNHFFPNCTVDYLFEPYQLNLEKEERNVK